MVPRPALSSCTTSWLFPFLVPLCLMSCLLGTRQTPTPTPIMVRYLFKRKPGRGLRGEILGGMQRQRGGGGGGGGGAQHVFQVEGIHY